LKKAWQKLLYRAFLTSSANQTHDDFKSSCAFFWVFSSFQVTLLGIFKIEQCLT
jgi:hypothetical protein